MERAGPQQWLSLAERAQEIGLESEAREATFRAADAAAMLGQCGLARDLCDKVLAAQPDHAAARRIRGLMQARLEDDAEQSLAPAGDGQWQREPTATFLGPGQVSPEWPGVVRGLSGELTLPEAECDTLTDWPPGVRTKEPEQARGWPTVLEEQSLLSMGHLRDPPDSEELNRLTERRELEPGQVLVEEGGACDLLYRLEKGLVQATRFRGERVDLGRIEAGSFFGDAGALSRLPATARLEAVERCTLTVISRSKLRQLLEEGGTQQRAVNLLKGLYLDAVLSITPLFTGCSPDERQLLASGWRFLSVKAGDHVIEPGQSGPLQVIVAGLAEVTLGPGTAPLGFLVPGDLVAEIDPSPVLVTARRDLYALAVYRSTLEALPETARQAFEARTTRCHQALPPDHGSASHG
jgi:CRP-like cAMP-binding protein